MIRQFSQQLFAGTRLQAGDSCQGGGGTDNMTGFVPDQTISGYLQS